MFKYIAFLLVLLPVLTFAEPLDKVVAVVNDGVITKSELTVQVNLLRNELMAKKMPIPPESALRKQVLQRLINADLVLQLAKKNKLSIENKELDEIIAKIAADNKLSLTGLKSAVEHQGLTWTVYKENLRKEIMINRLQQKAVQKDITVTAQQVEDFLKTYKPETNSQAIYQVQNIIIPLSENPTAEEIKKAQAKAQALLIKIKQGANFDELALKESDTDFALEGGDLGQRVLAELPELFAKTVVTMRAGEVKGPLRAGNGFQLIKLVATNAENLGKHQVTKTHVRHILLKADTSMTSVEAKRQALNLYEQLKSGKDFSVMAKQYSLDAKSAVKGGDLGWVTSGELVPEFEKVMDDLPVKKISQPVKSPFGWHLIEVLERKTMDDSKEFRRQKARMALQQQKFAQAVNIWQQQLRAMSYVKIMDKELA